MNRRFKRVTFLFISPSQKAALDRILGGIRERRGLMALIGEAELDKAALLFAYLEKTNQQRLKVLYIANANIRFYRIIKSVYKCLRFNKFPKLLPSRLSVYDLHRILFEENKKGYIVVIVIDNAHNVSIDILKKLSVLSGTKSYKDSLVQIVLVGLPILEKKLDLPEFHYIKDEIDIISYIPPMEEDERVENIHRRLINASMLDHGSQLQGRPILARLDPRLIVNFAGKGTRPFLRFVFLGAVGIILLASLAVVFLREDWRAFFIRLSTLTRQDHAVPIFEEMRIVTEETQEIPLEALTKHEESYVANPRSIAIAPQPGEVIQQVMALVHRFFPEGGDFALQVRPDKGVDAVYTAGENLVVDILAARDVYLQLDYYQADGQVVHLLPNSLGDNRVEAGKTFTLGKSENSFQFQISSPFGVEMLMVIASQQPLEVQQDVPSVEPASHYLERLSKSLKEYQTHKQVAVAYTRIRTQEQVGVR
jgi:type II secretory pathway predicted ATPase ExeA